MTTKPLRVVFMGSPDFAAQSLMALIGEARKKEFLIDIVGVFAQPPKPAHRGQKLTPCPVHKTAIDYDLRTYTPKSLRKNVISCDHYGELSPQELLQKLSPDLIIVAAYGMILPDFVLDMPTFGCVNLHASLLPRWRGAAPLQHALLNGDNETGITLMKMDAGLDTGDMISIEKLPITPTMTITKLHDQMASLSAKMIIQFMQSLTENGYYTHQKQPVHGSCYASKISKKDGDLHFDWPAEKLDRYIRTFGVWPGCWLYYKTTLNDDVTHRLKILSAQLITKKSDQHYPDHNVIDIQTGYVGSKTDDPHILCLDRVQKPGKKPMTFDALGPGFQVKQLFVTQDPGKIE